MSTQDQEFIKRLRATFKVEADEHLQAISSQLIELEKEASGPSAAATIETIYREAHSLKGAARAVDLQAIEGICQAMEGVFSAWKKKEAAPSPEAFDLLHQSLDLIRPLAASTETLHSADEQKRSAELIRQLARFQVPSTAAASREPVRVPPAPEPVHARPAAALSAEPEKVVADTVRIAIDKLDARLLQAEEMLSVKSLTAQRSRDLQALSAMLEQWHQEWNKVSQDLRDFRHAVEAATPEADDRLRASTSASLINFLDWNHEYLRSLENRVGLLASQGEQDRYNVGRRVDELLEDSKKLLMLPFSTLAQAFPKLIRDLSREQGKEVDLTIRGGEVEIDKRILEEMKDALIHILRNCIDHGVEKPEERQRLNKSPRATVSILVSQVNGNKVEIVVSDDGAGVDAEKVKASAVRQRIVTDAEAAGLGHDDAISLIFNSEVSTSPIVTAISGRGLGMAIVRTKAEKLGGRVLVESKPREGTRLRIVLPLTMATFRGILVAASRQTFVVPTMNVERVLRIKADQIQTMENRETVKVEDIPVSLARLGAVLDLPALPSPTDDGKMPVVVLHVAEQRIAFLVDQVLGEEEVLVKPLRRPLVRVRNIAGVTIQGSGVAVPILNVADLMKSARTHGAPPTVQAVRSAETARAQKRLLVVEDSITSRMLLKGILESAGYKVRVAVDGIDAFTILREEAFDLVVSDVEMPRMNGFDLTSKIRGDKRFAELPVVLVTALESREQREKGIDAGASAYIVKSRFDQSDLLEVIRRLI